MPVNDSTPAQAVTQSLESRERGVILDLAHRIIPAIGRSLPSTSEIVLHDLALLPNSIVAIWGQVTNRQVGDPPTDLLLEHMMRGAHHDLVGYQTYLPDGRQLQSSTIILRDSTGVPVGAFCVNSDVSPWITLQKVAEQMSGGVASLEPLLTSDALDSAARGHGYYPFEDSEAKQHADELFPTDVNELTAHLIKLTIQESGVSIDAMRKGHKVDVVRVLRDRGIFQLRDAAEIVGKAIGVSRFTVYNYLKELDGDGEYESHLRPKSD